MISNNSKISEQHIPCDDCGSSDAKCTYEDGHSYCFSCGVYTPPANKPKEFISLLQDDSNCTYEYVPTRGLNRSSLKHYNALTKIDPEGKPVEIGFKYPNNSYKIRSFDGKEFRTTGDISKGGLYGRNCFSAGSHKYVTITEGEYDAISLYQVLGSPVVSVQSSVTAHRDCAAERSWLNSYERIYLAFDADEPGREAAGKVAKLFDYNKVYLVKFDRWKDANDYLQHGQEEELRNIWWNSKRYLPDNVISSFSSFETILKEPIKEGIPYPFPTLNYMTYGIRTGESVLVTAQEGVGKTEFMHALEYQLLKETKDAIGAIYLEEPKRRHLQALAGLELKKAAHLPDSGVSDIDAYRAVKAVVQEDDRLHLYSHFGSDDPDHILDTIRFLVSARSCRYILLDHITMVVSGLAGENERRALDRLSTSLEMMVKELDFALLLVSHVNDDGLTRGSRNISKIADIRVDLHRDVISPDDRTRRTTYLTVSKNRFCGRTGPAGKLLFDPYTYTLDEDFGYVESPSIIPTYEQETTHDVQS